MERIQVLQDVWVTNDRRASLRGAGQGGGKGRPDCQLQRGEFLVYLGQDQKNLTSEYKTETLNFIT